MPVRSKRLQQDAQFSLVATVAATGGDMRHLSETCLTQQRLFSSVKGRLYIRVMRYW